MAFEDATGIELSLHEEPPADARIVLWGSDIPEPGPLVFDPADPRSSLRAVAETAAASDSGRVIAVRSASGGAGCTTIALHLAARSGKERKVCVVELDPRTSARCRLGLDAGSKTWADAGTTDEDLLLAAVPVPGGFRALVSPGDGTTLPGEVIRRAAALFDVVVLDAGRIPVPRECWANLLVVPPTRPACANALGALADTSVRWGIIINRTGSGGSMTRRSVERALGRPVLAELPCTPSLRDAEDEARLLDGPWTRWSRRMGLIVTAVSRP